MCVCVIRRNAAFLLDANAAFHGAGAAWDHAAPARPLGMRIRTRALASEPDDAAAERTARRGLAESLDEGHAGPAATTTCMATRGSTCCSETRQTTWEQVSTSRECMRGRTLAPFAQTRPSSMNPQTDLLPSVLHTS